MSHGKAQVTYEKEHGSKIFSGCSEHLRQLSEDKSHEKRYQIQPHHDECGGMKPQPHLLMGGDGEVGGIDEEDHHQQKHAVVRRMELHQLTRLKWYAAFVG